MIEKYHPIRQKAEKDYKKALKLERISLLGDDVKAHFKAFKACNIALMALVDAEIKYPTQAELRKAAKLRYLNR